MIARERMDVEVPSRPPLQVVPAPPTVPAGRTEGRSLLWRLILVSVGFGLAMLGWSLVLTVLLSFIGLPVFFFGLALMQAQER
jgi:hypothetical protein